MKVIEYYTASYCQPCKTFGPIMEELQFEGINISKIDIERRPNKAMENNVRSVPTCIIRKNGKEVDRIVGSQAKQTIKQRYENA